MRDLYVARIISGTHRIQLSPRRLYYVRAPSILQRHAAAEIHAQVYEECLAEGLHDTDSILLFMTTEGYWDASRQDFLDKLPKEIEEFKVKLFENTFQSNERKVIREALKVAKAKYIEVATQRNAFNHLTCMGVAAISQVRYIVGVNLYNSKKKRVFSEASFWRQSSNVLDKVIKRTQEIRLDESQFRELARTDPWRSIYQAGKHEGGIFGRSSAKITDDQRVLLGWSSLYDNISQHPDAPADSVIDDDDMLDGWLIKQKRQRDREKAEKAGDDRLSNEKIANSDEIYIPAESNEDARNVIDKNDAFGKMFHNQKLKMVYERGTVEELDLPDVRLRARMAANSAK